MTSEQVVAIRRQLDKMAEAPDELATSATALIKELDKADVTVKMLKKTQVGFSLDKVRKLATDEQIKKSAKKLLMKWKKLEEEAETKDKKNKKVDKEDKKAAAATAEDVARNAKGELVFPDFPDFRPNLSPAEVLGMGSFGGTYFRPIYSSCTKRKYGPEVWEELPQDWLKGLNVKTQVACPVYDASRNKYGVKCGGSLEMWEESGWMREQDPYGWFQWFCRFYQGRRTEDDQRQVDRWSKCAGPKGRWKGNLISKCVKSGCGFDNYGVSPVVRQTLQHWAYTLTKEHFDQNKKKFQK